MSTMKSVFYLLGFLFFSIPLFAQPENEAIRSMANAELKPFYHGVASGDPTESAVIIWTRVTPEVDGPVEVEWIVSTNPEFSNIVKQGVFITDATRDYTVKVDVTGLENNTYYYYEFNALGMNSITGRTKTAPADAIDQLRFAVVSCSNYPAGYFNVYEKIYERNDIDAVLHLGDYIYEGRGSSILSEEMPRNAPPSNELVVLGDYRIRHASHKLDSDSRKMHQNYPLIAVWDDHESANDSWRDGAENHTEGEEGAWVDRKQASLQAYYEWMPLRLPDETNFNRIFRKLSYGNLADIWMLDTRLYDRDEQSQPNQFDNPDRTLIGAEQMEWLQNGISASTAQYQVLGQQVVMAPWVIPNYAAGTFVPINGDQWDGYTAERKRLYDFIQEADIDNVVVLTGDVHTGWAQDLPYDIFEYKANNGAGSVGVEFVSNAVTSSSLDFSFPIGELLIPSILPWIKYVELTLKGYVILDLNASRVQGDFYTVGNIDAPTSGQVFQEGWYAPDGIPNLRKATTRSVATATQPPLAPLEPRDLTITASNETIQFDILGIYPNPFLNDLLMEVHLFENQNVSVSLFDAKGALMTQKDFGSLTTGRNLLTLHELNLPSGVYGVMLKVGEHKVFRQVVRN